MQFHLALVRGRGECLRCAFGAVCGKGTLIVNTAPADRTVCLTLEQCSLRSVNLKMSTDRFLAQLEQLLEKTKVSAVYIRPKGSYPCCHSLDEASATKLIELAKAHRFYIIEEDEEHEFWRGRAPLRPLVQLRHEGHVLYCCALSRTSPYMQHLRVVIAPAQLIAVLKSLPQIQQGYRDPFQEKKILQLLRTNGLATVSRQLRLAKKKDLTALKEILQLQLGKYISYEMPESGTAIWIQFPKKINLSGMLQTLLAEGHRFQYTFDGKKPAANIQQLRIDFSNFDRKEAKRTAARLRELIAKGGPY